MLKSKAIFLLVLVLGFGCGGGLKEGFDTDIDETYEGFDVLTYLQEGGSLVGNGEAVVGLLKTIGNDPPKKINLINFDLVPEDTNVRILDELRYDLRRLREIKVELRFPEDSKVDMMNFIEEYTYSTPGGESSGDMNNTKPVSEGGPYALVEVNYRSEVVFDKFTVKVIGTRIYNEDPSVEDFVFYDGTTGTQNSVTKIFSEGSFAQGSGTFTRLMWYKSGEISSMVKTYTKDEDGTLTGNVAGNSIDGIVLHGQFTIETANTPCLLDDTGDYTQTVNYPSSHASGKDTETAEFRIDVNGVYSADYTLEEIDGATFTKSLRRVITRPANCEEVVIRHTATLSGTDYVGNDLEISEVRARELAHIYGVKRPAEGSAIEVDMYRISGQGVYR